MKIKLKEKRPMSTDIWFEAGEIFEVIETKVMKHDNREWFKIKSHWFDKPLDGFHNPDDFEVIE